jgi:signal transduction histidine kinase
MISTVEGAEPLLSRLPLSRLSFRWQILLLGTLVGVLFVAVLFAGFATLRYTKSAVLSGEKKQLLQLTQNLAREYEDKAEFSRQNHEPTALSNAGAASSREVLALLARVVLQNAEGVTAGFYSSAGDALIGDSNQQNSEEVVAEATGRTAILEVARRAAANRQSSEKVLSNGASLLLIEAVPVREGEAVLGSAWAAKRLTELPGANRFRAYLTAAGLGTAALASVLLTLLVIRNLQGAVRKIESGLHVLEQNLESRMDTTAEPEEIQRIVWAINRLGKTLHEKIEREKQIENELRHAERLASLGRLVAGVAHEVRNPLATIRLRVQMCGRNTEDARVKESCAIALEEIERLNGMVNRLLNFARPVRLRREPTDVGDLVRERMESFREQASRNHIKLEVRFVAKERSFVVDKAHMAQVFDNIIQNAIDAMAEGGGTLSASLIPVETAGNGNGDGFRVEFRDTGKGMDSVVADHIFDPFFTTKPSGTGLGLSICHELVTAHGGGIHVESREGHGTNVQITIPCGHA